MLFSFSVAVAVVVAAATVSLLVTRRSKRSLSGVD